MANYIKQNDNNPVINSNFSNALDDLIEICHKGQSSNRKLFNPEDSFLIHQMKLTLIHSLLYLWPNHLKKFLEKV